MGEENDKTFKCLVKAIIEQVKLLAPDSTKIVCLFTDASDTCWTEVLTQLLRSEVQENLLPPQH